MRLTVVQQALVREGKLGPVLRLMPTTIAVTLHRSNIVADGPFAETTEQLLAVYVIDVPDLMGALAVARELSEANPGGVLEIHPIFEALLEGFDMGGSQSGGEISPLL